MGTSDTVTLHQSGVTRTVTSAVSSIQSGITREQPRRLAVGVTEAAQMLGISRSLAYELAHRGELPVIQLGRRLVVPIVALERLVDAVGSLTSADVHASPEAR